jgi:hypothetical protein
MSLDKPGSRCDRLAANEGQKTKYRAIPDGKQHIIRQ